MGSVRYFRERILPAKVPIREPVVPPASPTSTPSSSPSQGSIPYQAIFQAVAVGIVQCTVDGQVLETNAAIERMLGYAGEELRSKDFQSLTHPEDAGIGATLSQELADGQREGYEVELRCVRKDGSLRWVRQTFSLVRGIEGKPDFTIGVIEDITDRRRVEEQLREARKMEAIGRLVGGVAHDFNNLLTGIMLYCDLLMGGLEKGGRLRHHAEEIYTASQHGGTLIQQLLAVARQQAVEPQVLCLNEIVSDMANLLRRLIGEHIELVTELPDNLAKAKLDPAQVKQVVMNLVLNARDAMPAGGRITVTTANGKMRTVAGGTARQEQGVSLTVKDTGCGMTAETRSRIFEPFFTTKAAGEGNGLGLATVYSIVKQNSGVIEVESEPGRGTQVSVFFPRAEEPGKVEELGETGVPI